MELGLELASVWQKTLSFIDVILLKLLKNSLVLLGPSTSWSPSFWHVNQTWPRLPLLLEPFAYPFLLALLSYICFISQRYTVKGPKGSSVLFITIRSTPTVTNCSNSQCWDADTTLLLSHFLIQVGTWTQVSFKIIITPTDWAPTSIL